VGDAAAALVPTSGEARTPAFLAGPLVAANATAAQAAGCVREPTGSMRAALVAPSKERLAVRKLTLLLFVHEHRGETRVTACLPRLDALGGKSAVRRIALRIQRGLSAPPPGKATWRAFFTPVGKRGGPAAYDATVESRSTVISPSFLTLQVEGQAEARRGAPLVVAGALSVAGLEQGRSLQILAGPSAASLKLVGKTRTGKLGSYRIRVKAPNRAGALLVQARVPSRRLRCSGRTVDAPSGCRSATLAGIASNLVRLRLR
jgi:hypothetical protein